ncbi:MAG: GNAT family N-acetyltransferase [Pseudomonadota bacterium]
MTVVPITIRACNADDAAALQQLLSQQSAYANTLQLPYPSLDYWQQRLAPGHTPQLHRLVACRGSELLGEISLIPMSNARRSHVAGLGMVVSEHCRRQGVGRLMLAAAIDLAEQWLAIRRIELEVFVDNAPAIALYEQHGFVAEGVARSYAFQNGRYADVLRMARITLQTP